MIVVVIVIVMVMVIAAVTGETIARPSIVRRHPYRRHFPRMPWLVFLLCVVAVGVVTPWSKLSRRTNFLLRSVWLLLLLLLWNGEKMRLNFMTKK